MNPILITAIICLIILLIGFLAAWAKAKTDQYDEI